MTAGHWPLPTAPELSEEARALATGTAEHPIHPEHTPTGQLAFGVFFQGVNSSTIWRLPESGDQVAWESFESLIRTAERGKFAAFFLGEGLRLREHRGVPFELDVAGRPDAQTLLSALAAVTSKIGLVATQNTTFNDPVDLARRLQTLDLLSGGRAGWNIVTTDNAWTGENFRRGGYLDHADRYTHAEAFVQVAEQFWRGEKISHDGAHYTVRAEGTLPRSAQGRPTLFQAGASPAGQDFAARTSDVIFSPHASLSAAVDFRRSIVERTVAAGRDAGAVKILPGAEIVLAETEQEADEKVRWVRDLQIGPEQAIALLEQYWGRDLSEFDPEGPLPDVPPEVEESGVTRGAGFQYAKAEELTRTWREEAKEKGQNILEFARVKSGARRGEFTGSYDAVADRLAEYAALGAIDGLNITPWLIPSGLDDIVDHLIPRLQERGVYPEDYAGDTLRENLGLPPL
ncbi:LLM class flavin-dependent oxidoreductase [Brachybacterium aquaticum]|uniref:Alkanesulfonate monooxygenase SsuD/methylene tetrahydromethanopterin reductase-like flavin-dependent oxidoreductase (Luciferase family) n=1 Tax=Brachybacterium aquaticum TaxID=1432564 RepID=A0A841AFN4_9MICO|nr:LLM class flavin-dependent oxidoreductase [Brachybacterium aquaticum]MBB5832793.1 alkanesulfonate monooxygenase SsuD/methylene tetrahydromethanopterin reductase-like flavin-dependent oxidoreductase (luciferase family) [Brachybacterium aquaticum]